MNKRKKASILLGMLVGSMCLSFLPVLAEGNDTEKYPIIDRDYANLTIRYFDDSEETVPSAGTEFTVMKVAYSLTGKSSETLTDEEIEKYGLAEFADELQIAMQNLADAQKAYEDAVTEANAKKSVLEQTNTAYDEKKKAYDSATAAYNAYKKAEEDKKKKDEKKPATSEVIVADKKNTSKTAKTADESNIGLNAYMMVGSLTIAGVVVFAIRKKKMSE